MNESVESTIETAILEGNDRHETRRIVISQGYPTLGFDELYEQVRVRLGVEEPRPQVVRRMVHEDVTPQLHEKKPMLKIFVRLVTLLFVALVLWSVVRFSPVIYTVVYDFIPETLPTEFFRESNTSTLGTGIIKTKVDATFASARIYKGKMLDYHGVCTGVSVVPPIECRENGKSLVIYVPLSSGDYYCVDSSGKTGSQVDTSGDMYSCK